MGLLHEDGSPDPDECHGQAAVRAVPAADLPGGVLRGALPRLPRQEEVRPSPPGRQLQVDRAIHLNVGSIEI